jgi:hypothetical protein
MSMTKGTPASSQIVWLEGRVQELEAENEKLRAALESIADLPPGYADMRQDDLVVSLANKARAALEGK